MTYSLDGWTGRYGMPVVFLLTVHLATQMPDSAHLDGAGTLVTYIADNIDCEKIDVGDTLQAGDILCYGSKHIDIVGKELGEGKFEKYNGGQYTPAGSVEYQDHSCIGQISDWTSNATGALRIKWGSSSGNGRSYEGYSGNEAVVLPVTGILVEYGTYSAELAEENRENIDLKYDGLIEGYEYETRTVTDPETEEETEEIIYPSDQVGYAVIKLIDAETYKKLESSVEENLLE